MSSFGLVPQNYYWAWSLAAFVTIAAIIAACSLPMVVNPLRVGSPWQRRALLAVVAVAALCVAVWPRYPVASVAVDEVEARRVGRPLRAQLAAAIDAGVVPDHVEVDLSRAFFANDHPYVMLAALQRAGIEFGFQPDSGNLDRFGESRCVEAGRYQRLLLIAGADPELAPGSVIVAEVVGITDTELAEYAALQQRFGELLRDDTIDVGGLADADVASGPRRRTGGGAGDPGAAGDWAGPPSRRLAAIRDRLDPGGRRRGLRRAGCSSSNDRRLTTRRSCWSNRVCPTIGPADSVGSREMARQQAISPPRVIPGTVTTTAHAPRFELIRGTLLTPSSTPRKRDS